MENFFKKKILPAVTLDDIDSICRLAETLIRSGLDVMEITFRTDKTISAIETISSEFPDLKIGAGTILKPNQVSLAVEAGAQFGLSPGLNKGVVKAAQDLNFPFIPGVSTPSEIELALDLECKVLKFFPAEPMGGIKLLKAFSGPYNHTGVKFIPMGNINVTNMNDYLNLENVLAVGGSWLAPKRVIEEKEFDKISNLVVSALSNISS